MAKTNTRLSPRDRILEKAEDLFYRQGYLATGINQIIDESGVAKATFYAHFPSKEELCVAYLRRVGDAELELVRSTLLKRKTPISRYLAPFEILEPWLQETDFRGCPYLNIASEVSDVNSPIRKVGIDFYNQHRRVVEQAVQELKDSKAKERADWSVKEIAEQYMTIFVGTIGLCSIFHSIDPVKTGMRMVRDLVE